MCGIAGAINNNERSLFSDANVAESVAQAMASALYHRGPDGLRYYTDPQALLVHTRLSVIDLEGGHQPIHNEDKSIWVVFNGEIYNYIELREMLLTKGHQFYTHSDTEVIVHLYEEFGDQFVNYLNGQFAICLWDQNRQRAVLVRDRVGIAPLYYRLDKEGRLYFSSEIKAIIAGSGYSPTLNKSGLDQLFTFWAPVAPNTLFEGVFELPPGQLLSFEKGHIAISTYWDMSFPGGAEYAELSEQEAIETTHDLLVDATQIRLRSDVPVAAYLSGGLDSSSLVSLIKHHSDTPLTTFSITFEDKDLSEEKYQHQMAAHLGTEHRTIQCQNADIAGHFLDAIWHTEAPIIRTAPIPMGILSGLVRENHYKVVLTGEGADEVFGGYDIFKETKLREFWSKKPDSSWRPLLLKRLYPYMNLNQGNASAYLKNFFGGGVENPSYPLFSHLPRWTTTAKVKNFYSESLKSGLNDNVDEALISSLPDQFANWRMFNKAQYLEIKTLMGGYLLSSQGDRMLMKNSVEGRFPFLDHRVIEFANTLHPKLKMKGLNEKYVLKEAMRKYLPKAIVDRYKQPYRAPNIPSFFGDNTPEYVEALLSSEKLSQYGYFDPKRVGLLIKKIKAGRSIGYSDNMSLVSILSTQAWHHLFVENFHSQVSARTPSNLVIKVD